MDATSPGSIPLRTREHGLHLLHFSVLHIVWCFALIIALFSAFWALSWATHKALASRLSRAVAAFLLVAGFHWAALTVHPWDPYWIFGELGGLSLRS